MKGWRFPIPKQTRQPNDHGSDGNLKRTLWTPWLQALKALEIPGAQPAVEQKTTRNGQSESGQTSEAPQTTPFRGDEELELLIGIDEYICSGNSTGQLSRLLCISNLEFPQ